LKKPEKIRNFVGKPRVLDSGRDRSRLENAAGASSYDPSPYHCPDDRGKLRLRTKPASPCPTQWSIKDATRAIKTAIINGYVSKQWTSDGSFPRHVWHDAGGVWYEACTSDNAEGRYHGYPVDARTVPYGLVR
jgi:hypothetical protein